MNKYIVPVCEIKKSKVYNVTVVANSVASCKDKLIEKYSEYSDSDDWNQFLDDLDSQDIILGKITDIETL